MARPSAKSRVFLALICSACWGVIAPSAAAESVTTDFANLRAEPNLQGRIITALPKGTQVDVVRRDGAYAEVRVRRTGLSGWIYLPHQGWSNPERLPEPAPDPAPAAVNPEAATPTLVRSAEPVLPPAEPGAVQPPAPTSPAPVVPAPPTLAEAELMDAARALPRARGPWAYPLDQGDATRIPVQELRLEMDPLDAQVLFRKDPNDRSSFPVRVLDGQGVHVGKIAVKGNFSRNFLKKSLLVSLDKGEKAHGRTRFALNAMATDPSLAREWLAWDLIHKLGLTAPRAVFTRLYLNGESIGLYLDIEWMDLALFERLGLSDRGPDKTQFFEPDGEGYCGDLSPASLARADVCWSKLYPRDGDMTPLAELVQGIAATPVAQFDVWLEQHFEAQSVIDWLLINTLTQNGDTYNKNYFLHRSAGDHKWRVIPWDYDLAWGRVADPALPFPRMIYNGFFQYSFPADLGSENPLKRKVLENPRLLARFKARLAQVLKSAPGDVHPAAGWFEPLRFRDRLADLAALSRAARNQEKYPVPGAETADTQLEGLAFFNEWRSHILQGSVLENTVFGSPRWNLLPLSDEPPPSPEQLRQRRHQRLDLAATRELDQRHARMPLVEPLLGWPLGLATLREAAAPVRLTLETAREAAPRRLPPGLLPGQCIERTWFVSIKSDAPATLDLEFDYLHEASTRREVPDGLDESALLLHWFDGRTWRQPASHVNGLANLVALPELTLAPDVLHRFVACVPSPPQARP